MFCCSSSLCTALYAVLGLCIAYILHHVLTNSSKNRQASGLKKRNPIRTTPRGQGQNIVCTMPSTGEKICDTKAYTTDDVRRVIKESRVASEEFRHTSFAERKAVLQAISDWIIDNQKQICEMSVADSGKSIVEAELAEVMFTCEKIRWTIANGEKALKREYRPTAALLMTKAAYIDYFPLGVIGVIVPWNYPFQNVIGAVVAALMAGNGCVVKVSEYASGSAEKIECMIRNILAERGHNPDLVQIITGFGETGNALVTGGVDKLLFIGSPAVGKLVAKAAADSLTPVILELGGKDPFIVFDDCDFNHLIDLAIRGAFVNCGQNCISAERFYVQAGVYDKFVSTIAERAAKLGQGHSSWDGNNRCDVGAMTMPAQVNIVEKLLEDAVKKGAKVVLGGKKFVDSKSPSGRFFSPTILSNVNHSMDIANHEAFGPVMSIIKFNTEEEVIKMANSTEYGLGSSIFTKDYKKAERVQQQLECGMCNINDFGMVPMLQCLPFGGIRSSGYGVFNGYEGLRGFSRMQSVCTDRFGIRTDAPPFMQYPIPNYTPKIVEQIVRMVYGRGYGESISAITKLIKLALAKK